MTNYYYADKVKEHGIGEERLILGEIKNERPCGRPRCR